MTERERGAMHELTAELVREHGGRVYVEDLKIPNLLRNRRLARSIAEQNWGGFVSCSPHKRKRLVGGYERFPRITRRSVAPLR